MQILPQIEIVLYSFGEIRILLFPADMFWEIDPTADYTDLGNKIWPNPCRFLMLN